MKIGIISDIHLGVYKSDENLFNSAFDGLKEGLEKLKDCDIILCGGDIFDSPNEPPNVLVRAVEIFEEFKTSKDIPIYTVIGNHDYRFISKTYKTQKYSLDLLVSLNYIPKKCLSSIWCEELGDVNIIGMRWVPDDLLKKNKGELMSQVHNMIKQGKFNILILHQFVINSSLGECIDEVYLSDFDLVIA